MDVATPESVTIQPRRSTRWRGWLVVGVLLAVVVGHWWLTQPRQYHFVARSTTHDVTLIPCRQGYLTLENQNTFVLRDWTTGRERWRVACEQPRRVNYKLYGFTSMYSIGQQGDVFAVLTLQGNALRLQVWRDGVAQFDQVVAELIGPSYPRVRVLNDGRVMVWNKLGDQGTAMVLLKDGVIAAKGTLPVTSRMFVAPDGAFAVEEKLRSCDYLSLTFQGATIAGVVHPIAGLSVEASKYPPYDTEVPLLAGGLLVGADDLLYDQHGKVPGQTMGVDTVTPGGQWVLQTDEKDHVRAFAPATGDHWDVKNRGNRGGDVTMDGRYVLAYFSPTPPPAVQRMLAFAQDIGLHLPDPAEGEYVGLYERPGTLRAIARLDRSSWSFERYGRRWWFPSPDGHSLAVCMDNGGGGQGECVLLRW